MPVPGICKAAGTRTNVVLLSSKTSNPLESKQVPSLFAGMSAVPNRVVQCGLSLAAVLTAPKPLEPDNAEKKRAATGLGERLGRRVGSHNKLRGYGRKLTGMA